MFDYVRLSRDYARVLNLRCSQNTFLLFLILNVKFKKRFEAVNISIAYFLITVFLFPLLYSLAAQMHNVHFREKYFKRDFRRLTDHEKFSGV